MKHRLRLLLLSILIVTGACQSVGSQVSTPHDLDMTPTSLAEAGAAPEPRRGQPTEEAHLTEQIGALARLLEARPHLLFIDDLHHLPPEPVGDALRYLARHVRRSRRRVKAPRLAPRYSPAAARSSKKSPCRRTGWLSGPGS